MPTKTQKGALSANFNCPVGEIETSAFFDDDAEAVRLKHIEEVREETEITEITSSHPKMCNQNWRTRETNPNIPIKLESSMIFDDDVPEDGQPAIVPGQPSAPMVSSVAASSAAASIDVPETPDLFAATPTTPRQNPTTRQHEVETKDHEAKRARVEISMKQRLERISTVYNSMVRMVKFANETFHTMDEYEHDLQLDGHSGVDAWMEGEKEDLPMNDMPPELWSC